MDSIWIPDIYLYNTASDPMSELAYTKATNIETTEITFV